MAVVVEASASCPTLLPVASGQPWNVETGVVPRNAWRFGRSVRFIDPVTALKLTDAAEGSVQGPDLQAFYRVCGVELGDEYLVIPQPEAPIPLVSQEQAGRSYFICNKD